MGGRGEEVKRCVDEELGGGDGGDGGVCVVDGGRESTKEKVRF